LQSPFSPSSNQKKKPESESLLREIGFLALRAASATGSLTRFTSWLYRARIKSPPFKSLALSGADKISAAFSRAVKPYISLPAKPQAESYPLLLADTD
jgi:hypothetical protein